MIKYAVYPFTGTVYDNLTPNITAHHAQYDQTLVPVIALLNNGTDDNPDWQPVYPTLEQKRQMMVVSRFQALVALDEFGYLDAAEALIASDQATKKSKLAWQNALEFRRMSPMVLDMAPKLGISPEKLDEIFDYAKTVEA